MTLRPCTRQSEVKGLLDSGHWPHACPADLREHLAGCRSCSEFLLVTRAFKQDRAAAVAVPHLPAPGAIWWRAQLRRRNAAMRQVSRPILGAYVFALLMLVVVAGAVAVSRMSSVVQWLGQAQWDDLPWRSFNPLTMLNLGLSGPVLIPVFATLALLGAVAVYLATEKQ
jgi:predicted anti-sigma-YlaC factor YlaD